MVKFLSRPRVRGLVAATAVAGGVVLGMAAPAQADYRSPMYGSLSACNAARPAHSSSWSSPGPCYRVEYYYDGGTRYGWYFTVKTR